MGELLTVREVAEVLRVSTETVRRMVARGDLVGHRVSERRLVVRGESVRLLLDRTATG